MTTALERVEYFRKIGPDLTAALAQADLSPAMADAIVGQSGVNLVVVEFLRQYFGLDNEAHLPHTYEVLRPLTSDTPREAGPLGPGNVHLAYDESRPGCSRYGERGGCLRYYLPHFPIPGSVEGGTWSMPHHACPRADTWTLLPDTTLWVRLLGEVVVTRRAK